MLHFKQYRVHATKLRCDPILQGVIARPSARIHPSSAMSDSAKANLTTFLEGERGESSLV